MKKIIRTFSLLIITLFSVLFINVNNSQIAYADTTETTNIIETDDNAENTNEKLNNDENVTYIVQDGDTLWDIAYEFFGDPTLFGKIYDANSDLLSEPQLIYPGQELIICLDKGNSEEENIQEEVLEETPETIEENKVEEENAEEETIDPADKNLNDEDNYNIRDGLTFSKNNENEEIHENNNSNKFNSGELTFLEDDNNEDTTNNLNIKTIFIISIIAIVILLIIILLIQIILTLFNKKKNKKNSK